MIGVNFVGATMHQANLCDSNLQSSIFIDRY
ncbi:pentapeptide repeat-containing protein [Arsenophonus endosymbiont of Aleurodicus floccissimus]